MTRCSLKSVEDQQDPNSLSKVFRGICGSRGGAGGGSNPACSTLHAEVSLSKILNNQVAPDAFIGTWMLESTYLCWWWSFAYIYVRFLPKLCQTNWQVPRDQVAAPTKTGTSPLKKAGDEIDEGKWAEASRQDWLDCRDNAGLESQQRERVSEWKREAEKGLSLQVLCVCPGDMEGGGILSCVFELPAVLISLPGVELTGQNYHICPGADHHRSTAPAELRDMQSKQKEETTVTNRGGKSMFEMERLSAHL